MNVVMSHSFQRDAGQNLAQSDIDFSLSPRLEHYLGLYDTPEEAAQARDAAIIGLGLQDIAPLNNP